MILYRILLTKRSKFVPLQFGSSSSQNGSQNLWAIMPIASLTFRYPECQRNFFYLWIVYLVFFKRGEFGLFHCIDRCFVLASCRCEKIWFITNLLNRFGSLITFYTSALISVCEKPTLGMPNDSRKIRQNSLTWFPLIWQHFEYSDNDLCDWFTNFLHIFEGAGGLRSFS